jgi:hypothetical protein
VTSRDQVLSPNGKFCPQMGSGSFSTCQSDGLCRERSWSEVLCAPRNRWGHKSHGRRLRSCNGAGVRRSAVCNAEAERTGKPICDEHC